MIRDILHRLNDRFPSHVLVWPVMVQGQGAAEQIAAAVEGFSRLPEGGAVPRPDLVIVARGGGSIEDLWAFNEEVVVRAVAACTIPTISAVGHETDTTLCDFAADLRAPTPTAAAEIAVPVRQELRALLDEYAARQRRGVIRPVGLARERLQVWSERLPDPAALVEAQGQRLDDLTDRLRRGLAGRAEQARRALAESGGGLRPALLQRNVDQHKRELARVPDARALVIRRHREADQQIDALQRVLRQFNPRAPLARGYTIVRDATRQVVTNRDAATSAGALSIEFHDGEIDVTTGVAPAVAPPPPKPRRRSPPKSSQEGNDSGQQSLF